MKGYFNKKTLNAPRCSEHPPVVGGKNKHIIHGKLGIIIIIIINGTLARSLEPVVTECKEHTIHTQTQIVASRKPK